VSPFNPATVAVTDSWPVPALASSWPVSALSFEGDVPYSNQ
jgi:hypothetical protein